MSDFSRPFEPPESSPLHPYNRHKDSHPIHTAASTGDIAKLRRFLDSGTDVNFSDHSACTPLWHAMRNYKPAAFEFLLDRGGDPYLLDFDAYSNAGVDLFFRTVCFNAPGILEILIKREKKGYEERRLMLVGTAARYGSIECLRMIMESSPVNLTEEKWMNEMCAALVTASGNWQVEVVEYVLNCGIDFQEFYVPVEEGPGIVWMNNGWTNEKSMEGIRGQSPLDLALQWAMEVGSCEREDHVFNVVETRGDRVIELLVEEGADLSGMIPKDDDLALQMAFHNGISAFTGFSPRFIPAKMVRYLLDNGAEVNTPDKDGRTPLFQAVQESPWNMELAKRYCNDEEIEMRPQDYGYLYDDLVVVRWLLEARADVTAKSNNGQTPLHLVSSGDIAEVLIEAGADPVAMDDEGLTPLHMACSSQRTSVVKALVRRKHVVDVNSRSPGDWTPLMHTMALPFHGTDIIRCLLENGADVNASTTLGWTALHRAVGQIRAAPEAVALLLEHGANVNARAGSSHSPDQVHQTNMNLTASWYYENSWPVSDDISPLEETPLHWAAKYSSCTPEIIQMLIDKGAEIDAKNSQGGTPLHLAVLSGQTRLVKKLMENGADSAAVDNEGKTAIYFAEERNFTLAPDGTMTRWEVVFHKRSRDRYWNMRTMRGRRGRGGRGF